jgi:hypothetical protein
LQQLPNGRLTVTRFAVELVARLVKGGDYRLDVVPVFGLGVLLDDCLAAGEGWWCCRPLSYIGLLDASTASSIGFLTVENTCVIAAWLCDS